MILLLLMVICEDFFSVCVYVCVSVCLCAYFPSRPLLSVHSHRGIKLFQSLPKKKDPQWNLSLYNIAPFIGPYDHRGHRCSCGDIFSMFDLRTDPMRYDPIKAKNDPEILYKITLQPRYTASSLPISHEKHW